MDISFTPSGQRNAGAITELLQRVLGRSNQVFEIGSGTLQHAAMALQMMPDLRWQPSEQRTMLREAQRCWSRLNLPAISHPIEFTVGNSEGSELAAYDLILTINTLHIMPMTAVSELFELLGSAMSEGSRFLAYGPMRVNGEHISDGNRRFDQDLQASGQGQAIPDIDALHTMAQAGGLAPTQQFMMPANNVALIWSTTKS